MIALENAIIQAGPSHRIGPITAALPKAGLVAVVGPNGAGKSTLLAALSGFLQPSIGRILLNGEPVHGLPATSRAAHLALVSQSGRVPAGLTALDILLLSAPGGATSTHTIERATQTLRQLEIEHLADRVADTLSGGQIQRVLVARALLQRTPLLLLDEPTSAQDYDGVAAIMGALHERSTAGLLTVMAAHDVQLALNTADLLLLLDRDGGFVGLLPPASAATAVAVLYDGRVHVDQMNGRWNVSSSSAGNPSRA